MYSINKACLHNFNVKSQLFTVMKDEKRSKTFIKSAFDFIKSKYSVIRKKQINFY